MQNVSDIFHELGGPTAISKKLECGLSTVTEMKRRRSIPVRYWQRLIEMSDGKLTPEILMLVNAHERESADDAA
jgi:hypothetical protein